MTFAGIKQTTSIEKFASLGVDPEFLILNAPRTGKDGIRWSAVKFNLDGKKYLAYKSVVMQNSLSLTLIDADQYDKQFGVSTVDNVELVFQNMLGLHSELPEILYGLTEIEDKDFSEDYHNLDQEDTVLWSVIRTLKGK